MVKPSVKLDAREFNSTLKEYVKYSRRDLATVLNTKGFYIARRAVVETHKANAAAIKSELKGKRSKIVTLKNGRTKKVKYSLAQLLVLARRVKKGESASKKDMADEVKKLIDSRARAAGFIKSGWLPAVKKLEGLAEKIKSAARLTKKNSGVIVGKPKGEAKPAREFVRSVCTITNNALPRPRSGGFFAGIVRSFKDANRERILSYAKPALQRAFDFEVRSMKTYIEKKLRDRANRLGIRTR